MTTNAKNPLADFNLLVQAHALKNTHSQRGIADELKISRQHVGRLLKIPCPVQAGVFTDIAQDLEPTLSRVLGVQRITELAVRPQGVKFREYKHILGEVFGFVRSDDFNGLELNMQETDHRSLKHSVRRLAHGTGQQALFVPDWMDTTQPVECNQAMLIAAQKAYEAIEAAVFAFCNEYPGTQFKSAMREITALAVPGMTPEPIINRCKRNAATARALGHSVLYGANGPSPLKQASRRASQDEWPAYGPDDVELNKLCV
ncbi:hypothetical protein [Pseudomonas savastanoi]|uniref:Uncharacterized protein n=1 Tax=Pseudomonas savastanoi pv. glycinea TaxID=318 RepID=A0A0N8RLN8_PSESG|nr:hypothetical protein [Pseudomonas savastanoi]EFW81301.1 hypothetical protein PsgB076_07402 [Pseudomonas savastanoi pv. glycinea str. B076]KPC26215.1 Uncharacterized protein AC498_2202 [Pseudomonas savastanoi pv. glycinea]KPC30687.1 Uncharacterized protein AC497_1830 [Pseudomonas savastanoi pv. glycinea]KPC40417.1 Uncharacterized protein AC496_4976 [Pseudomonas savastanoi pv. glycinea]KPC41596.1 Uncharacterized protein ABK00_2337 [Pseudomonas savastanoi pv. glycinea]